VTGPEEDAIIGQRFVTPDLNRSEVAAALKTIEDKFRLDWLTDNSAYHPIRDLWSRADFIALQELFSLGNSIQLIEAVDASWIADAIKQAKSFERNNRAGYIFEIMAIAAMMRGGATVTPADPNTEAYDCDTALSSGDIARISLKNFGESTRETEFKKNARSIAKHVRSIAEKKNPRWFGVFAECSTYPSDRDWAELKQSITASRLYGEMVTKGNWSILFTLPPVPAVELATSFYSFGTQIAVPHYKNESKNFIASIEKGCAKLNAAAPTYGPTVRPMLIIRLSENADIRACTSWAKGYLNRVPPPNIAGVLVLQMTVAQNLQQDTTSVANNFDIAWRPGVPAPNLTISMQVGVSSTDPSRPVLIKGEKQIPLDGKHWFSDTHVYRAVLFDFANPGDGVSADVHQVPGHVTHGVFRSPDGQEMAISPKHITPDKLTMYS